MDGRLVPYTESPTRVEVILAALRTADLGPIVPAEDFGLAPIAAVHSADYLEHLQTIYADWVATGGAPEAALPFCFQQRGMLRASPAPAAALGYYAFDLSAPITATSWEAILASAQVALTGADALRRGERLAYALCRPPGHHAAQDWMGGYCYLNNAAIAAHTLSQGGRQRVALVDIDVHAGNGTQRIFYERDDVLFISIHGSPTWEYPYFMGFADERGAGAGLGYTINYPLAQGAGDEDYLSVLDQALAAVRRFGPAYLLISAGFDAYDGDPLGKLKLTTACFGEIGARLAALGLPTLVVQEGGYAMSALGANVVSLLRGLARI
jgi:acetoin utilization deacetylase AcuC-like enzyme